MGSEDLKALGGMGFAQPHGGFSSLLFQQRREAERFDVQAVFRQMLAEHAWQQRKDALARYLRGLSTAERAHVRHLLDTEY